MNGLIDSLIDSLIEWVMDWLINQSIDWLTDWLVDWVSDWSIDWTINWVSDWLIDWLPLSICWVPDHYWITSHNRSHRRANWVTWHTDMSMRHPYRVTRHRRLNAPALSRCWFSCPSVCRGWFWQSRLTSNVPSVDKNQGHYNRKSKTIFHVAWNATRRHRRQLTSVSNVCEVAPIPLFWTQYFY